MRGTYGGTTGIAIEVPEDAVLPYEWLEEHDGYRQFAVPAEVPTPLREASLGHRLRVRGALARSVSHAFGRAISLGHARMSEALDIYCSQVFDIEPEVLEAHGAFDVSLINDLPLFVDPFLLFNSKDPTLRGLHDEIISRGSDVSHEAPCRIERGVRPPRTVRAAR